MSRTNTHRYGIFLMVCTTVMWSSAGILTRQLHMQNGFAMTFWRSFFAALFVCVALVVIQGRAGATSLMRIHKHQIFSGLMWATMFCCFMLALSLTTVANTLIMSSLAPLVTALIAYLVLHQTIARHTVCAIVLALFGVIWMFAHDLHTIDNRNLLGMAIAFGVPLTTASNIVILKKAHAHVNLLPAVFWGGIFSALWMLPWTIPTSIDVHDLGILFLLGCIQLGFPCMLMVQATRLLSAPEVSLLALLEVLLGPIWVWLGHGERPTQHTLIGGAIVLGAVAWNAGFGLWRSNTIKS